MELSENYRITYDSRNVTLHFREIRDGAHSSRRGKTGPYEVKEETYYPTLKLALQAFLHKSMLGCSNIEECISRIEEAEKRIEIFTEKLKIK